VLSLKHRQIIAFHSKILDSLFHFMRKIMGFAGMRPGSLILILLIIMLLFGTRKLRDIGGDLGAAVKSFREGLQGLEIDKNKDEKQEP
jgi:sec-independent protein translocase protein TatA